MELLLQCCITCKSQQEYEGVNWEDVRNKHLAILRGFQMEKTLRKLYQKTTFLRKLKTFQQTSKWRVRVVKKMEESVLYLHFTVYVRVYGEAVWL